MEGSPQHYPVHMGDCTGRATKGGHGRGLQRLCDGRTCLGASHSCSWMQFTIVGEAFRDRKCDKFPFQCFMTLTAKELFLITKLQATSHSLNAFFLLMSLVEMGNSWSPSHIITSLILKTVIISLLTF